MGDVLTEGQVGCGIWGSSAWKENWDCEGTGAWKGGVWRGQWRDKIEVSGTAHIGGKGSTCDTGLGGPLRPQSAFSDGRWEDSRHRHNFQVSETGPGSSGVHSLVRWTDTWTGDIPGVTCRTFKSHHFHPPAVWPWASHWACQSLSFHMCKWG